MQGIIVWAGVGIINLSVLFAIQIIRKSSAVPPVDLLLAALISDLLSHLIIACTSNFGEMIMWAMISFPLVGAFGLLVCLLGKLAYDRCGTRHDVGGSKDNENI